VIAVKSLPLVLLFRVLVLCFIAGCMAPSFAESGAASSQASAAGATASSKAPAAKTVGGNASTADIAAAKASGKVWVNLNTGIYHRGGRWYGKTKDGKFMTADEAKKAGYKAAKRD
jgi:hypothetical protein